MVDGNLLIAGGCNFPDIPVADGGKKAYYRDIYIAPLSNDTAFEWKKIGQLPQAAAYGVTISTEKGLICVGGTTATHSLSDVFLLSLQKSIANRHAAWYNRLKEVRGEDFVVNMKTIGSAVVIILAAIVGLFLGAAMNDGLSGSILLAVIAGFVCVIYTIENSGKK